MYLYKRHIKKNSSPVSMTRLIVIKCTRLHDHPLGQNGTFQALKCSIHSDPLQKHLFQAVELSERLQLLTHFRPTMGLTPRQPPPQAALSQGPHMAKALDQSFLPNAGLTLMASLCSLTPKASIFLPVSVKLQEDYSLTWKKGKISETSQFLA